ncbi:MAG TPA: hypothetical protein VGK50_05875 [Coriobacteriia bacterium]|jgi:hypothetical protein
MEDREPIPFDEAMRRMLDAPYKKQERGASKQQVKKTQTHEIKKTQK